MMMTLFSVSVEREIAVWGSGLVQNKGHDEADLAKINSQDYHDCIMDSSDKI